jgi:hypothetical protein
MQRDLGPANPNAGFIRKSAQISTVTLIQRFGGALTLNMHFHL